MNNQLPIEIPAPVIRAAYHRLPVEGRVIISHVKGLVLHKDNLEDVTFYNRQGKQVYPQPDKKTGFIRYHQGFVVQRDNTSPTPCLMFIYLVSNPKKGQNQNENR